jgi:hypothetical protein
MVLRRISGTKMDEVTGGWRNMHNKELLDLYSFLRKMKMTQVKEDEIGGACSMNRG